MGAAPAAEPPRRRLGPATFSCIPMFAMTSGQSLRLEFASWILRSTGGTEAPCTSRGLDRVTSSCQVSALSVSLEHLWTRTGGISWPVFDYSRSSGLRMNATMESSPFPQDCPNNREPMAPLSSVGSFMQTTPTQVGAMRLPTCQ